MKGERPGMNNLNMIKLNRKILYDEIWKLSVSGVAKKYNLNYSKLIKSLKENNIPYPSSGYWTKLTCGKDVSNEVVPLPASEIEEVYLSPVDYNSVAVQNSKNIESVSPQPKKAENTSKVDKKEKGSTFVPDNILLYLSDNERKTVLAAFSEVHAKRNSKLHPILVAYKKTIEEWRQKENSHIGRMYYDNRSGISIKQPALMSEVSEAGLNRVIIILDAIYKTIEKLGGKVIENLSMKIREDIVRITFAEGQDKCPHELTKREAKDLLEYKDKVKHNEYASKPQIKKYDYFYNGKLRIKFENGSYIRDNEQQKLEDRLNEILIQLYNISETNRKIREKREEDHRKYLEEKRREEKRLENIEKEKQKTQSLVNEAKDYQLACEIRNYIKSISDGIVLTDEKKEWVKWAEEKADWFDPTIAREDIYLGKREHTLSEDKKQLIKERNSRFY